MRIQPMNRIRQLKNQAMQYAWGSRTQIQSLLGERHGSQKPVAELWMGAHPKAPSRIYQPAGSRSLAEILSEDPAALLGKSVSEKFSGRFPFLFKILAAEHPLSLQVHPAGPQARAGFAAENRRGIPLDAFERNYKDPNPKPELLCALSPFRALKGFRPVEEIVRLLQRACPLNLQAELAALKNRPDASGLRAFFGRLMRMPRERRRMIIREALNFAGTQAAEDSAFEWMVKLHTAYPEDIGVLAPLLLNPLELEPGEATYIAPGELHTYLNGMGAELMASSDNVLRGALTAKHIDVPELMKVVRFNARPAEIIRPLPAGPAEELYHTPAEEFMLSAVRVDNGKPYISAARRSVEIIIFLEGEGSIEDSGSGECLLLKKGISVIVPAAVRSYRIEGRALLYKASVPI